MCKDWQKWQFIPRANRVESSLREHRPLPGHVYLPKKASLLD